MKLVLVSIVTALILVAAAPLCGQGTAPLQQRSLDISALCTPQIDEPGPAVTPPLAQAVRWLGGEDGGAKGWPEPRGISADQVVDLVRMLSPDSWEEEGALLGVDGSLRLSARNRADILRDVQAYVAYLEAVMLHRSRVRVYLLPQALAADLAGTGVLGPAEVARLVRAVGTAPAAYLPIQSGTRARVRVGETRTFIAEYDVEVAQEAQIADPRVLALTDGLDLGISADVMEGGRLLLRVEGHCATLEEGEIRELGSTWLGIIHLPVVDSVVVAATAVVPDGGGILVGSTGGADDSLLLVTVDADPLPQSPPAKGPRIISPGIVDCPRRLLGPLGIYPPLSSHGGEERSPFDSDEVSFVESDVLLDEIRNNVKPAGWDEEMWAIRTLDRRVVVGAPAQVGAEVAGFLGRLIHPQLQTITLEIRAGFLDLSVAGEVVAGEADLAAVAGLLGTKAFVTTLPGESFRVCQGRETAFLHDHDVEIAQEATIADPNVAVLFTGMGIQGAISRRSGGLLHLRGEFVIQELVGEIVSCDTNTDDIGLVDLPRTLSSRGRFGVPLESGQWTALRVVPCAGRASSLAILVRARS